MLALLVIACNLSSRPNGTLDQGRVTVATMPNASETPLPTNAPPTLSPTPDPNACLLTPAGAADITVFMQPSLLSGIFGSLVRGSSAVVAGRTVDGWYGIDQGVTPASSTDEKQLRWISPNNAVTLTGTCDGLPVLTYP
jgi:hypothetical protein